MVPLLLLLLALLGGLICLMGSGSFHFVLCCAPILDVGLLTVVGVSCEASVQLAHSQAISCSPMSHVSRAKPRTSPRP
jgi:hypothetical protein